MKDMIKKEGSVCKESRSELLIPPEIRDWKASIAAQTQSPPKEIRSFDPLTQLELSN